MANEALLEKLDKMGAEALGDDALPRAFGPYTLLASVAKGGMGEVFLARSGTVKGFEKHCVVKTLRPHLTDDREYVARFIDEARVVVQLGHRNVCQVFDVGRVGERYYLAMEQVAGKDLRAVLDALEDDPQQPRRLDTALAIHVIGEVLEALDYAHRFVDVSGTPLLLVHRDVSPQNVMLSWEGEVKLIDFGLAASSVKLEQTSPNVVMGKLAYMAPEQVRGEKLDARADLFATAVMLTEMLTGERFYAGKDSYEIWTVAAQGGFRPRAFATLDPGLRTILDRALAARRDERQGSCLELREELMRWRQVHGLYADGPTLRKFMQERFADEIRAHREFLAGVSSKQPVAPGASSESTKSIARRAEPGSQVAVVSVPARPDRDPTEPTLVTQRWGRARLAGTVAAAVTAVAVAAAVAVVASAVRAPRSDPDSAVPVTAPPPPSPSNPPSPSPSTLPSPPSPSTPPSPPQPPGPAAPPPPSASAGTGGAPAPVVSHVGDKRPHKKPKPTKPRPGKPVSVGEPPVDEPRSAPPVEPPPAPAVAWADLRPTEKVKALAAACPRLACVADLQARVRGYGNEIETFKRDLEHCHAVCGQP